MTKKLVEISEEIYTHESLWRSATALVNRLNEDAEDKHHLILPALITIYLAYEAFVNFCGFILLPSIWEKEKEQFKGKKLEDKLTTIISHLDGLQWDKGRRPYQTIIGLASVREYIAHGKVIVSDYIANVQPDGSHFRFKHKWDNHLNAESVLKAQCDVKLFCQTILVAMRKKCEHRHLIFDAFEGSLASGSGRSVPK